MKYRNGLILILVLTAVSALVMPPGMADPVRQVGVVFKPIAGVARYVAGSITDSFVAHRPSPSEEATARKSASDVAHEKYALENQVAVLMSENKTLLEQLKEFHYNRLDGSVGVAVVGAALGSQQVLIVQKPPEAVKPGMIAKYQMEPANLGRMAGKVEIVGIGEANVRLITDRKSRVRAKFWGDKKDVGFTELSQTPKVATGTGNGKLLIVIKHDESTPQSKKERPLAAGDWVRVSDSDLPSSAQDMKLGEIESILPDPDKPLFDNVLIKPDADLMKLNKVRLMVRD